MWFSSSCFSKILSRVVTKTSNSIAWWSLNQGTAASLKTSVFLQFFRCQFFLLNEDMKCDWIVMLMLQRWHSNERQKGKDEDCSCSLVLVLVLLES
jgi:hypothetical protein